jgi:hypothetical protein
MSERQAAAAQMRRDGLTFAEIGLRLGVSRQRAHQLVNQPERTEKRKAYARRYYRERWQKKSSINA